jgi:hypothetical protein
MYYAYMSFEQTYTYYIYTVEQSVAGVEEIIQCYYALILLLVLI